MYAIRIKSFPVQLLYVMGLIPFIYFILFILYKVFSQVALFRTCCSRIVKTCHENQLLHIPRDDNIDENLPDRIVNPDVYRPLLPTTNSAVVNPLSDCQPQAGVNTLAAYGSL